MPIVSWFAVSALLAAPDIGLRWDAPSVCPPADVVRSAVADLTGAQVRDSGGALQVTAAVAASGDRFRATVLLEHDRGAKTRELDADDCAVLARAVAVIVAVGLDPVTVAATLDTTATATQAEASTVEEKPRQREERTPPPLPPDRRVRPPDHPPARNPTTFEYGGRVGGGFGGLTLPGFGGGVTAAAFVGVRRLHVRITVQYWPSREAVLTDNDSAGARLQLVTGGVRVCPNVDVARRWRFPLCAGLDAGSLLGRGRGSALQEIREASSPYAAVILQPGVVFSITDHLGVWLAFEGAISLNRRRFHLDGGGELHRVAAFGPRGLIGVVLQGRRTIP